MAVNLFTFRPINHPVMSSRHQVYTAIYDQGVMPLFYHPDVEIGKQVLKACYDAGGRLLEFTNRGDFAHETFRELSRYAQADLPGMHLGIGSIVDAPTAALYLQLGARFVVSAALRPDVACICNRRKVAYLPGIASLSEVARAEELGCEIVKLFPGSTYGPGFIKAISAPQPWTSIMPTGGVSMELENLKAWYGAGAVCVGLGSKLINEQLIDSGDFGGLSEAVAKALSMAKELRS